QGATVDQGMIVSLFPVNAIWVNSYGQFWTLNPGHFSMLIDRVRLVYGLLVGAFYMREHFRLE
ncbi:hypothetical protein ACV1C6_22000, partial [Aeromonas sanarellii]